MGGRCVGFFFFSVFNNRYRILVRDFKANGENSIYCYGVIFIFHFYDNLFVLKRIFPKS